MSFKTLHAYKMAPSGRTSTTLNRYMISKLSISCMSQGDDDHILMELTNGVCLKVPGVLEEIKSYIEEPGDPEEEQTAIKIKRKVGLKIKG